MKILKNSANPDEAPFQEIESTCGNCQTKLVVQQDDVKYDCCNKQDEYWYNCPVCKIGIWVARSEAKIKEKIPYWLRLVLKAEYERKQTKLKASK